MSCEWVGGRTGPKVNGMWLALAGILACGCAATTPRAPPAGRHGPPVPAPEPPAPPEYEEEPDEPRPVTYRAQIIGADLGLVVVGTALSVTLLEKRSDTPKVVAVSSLFGAAYVAAGPLIHRAMGNRGQVVPSLLRRCTLGALGGLLVYDCREPSLGCELAGPVLGGAGVLIVTVWDAARARYLPAAPSVAPVVRTTSDGVSLGFAGRF